MKIGILTYYGVFNHGAVLQANALKMVIRNLEHECNFIRFNRNYDMIPREQVKKYNISLKSVTLYAKYLMKKGVRNTFYNLKKNAILNAYRQAELPLGEQYNEFSGDAVVIGSDEVFSLEIGVNPFFYGHGLKSDKVLSYAGSFGPTTIHEIKAQKYDRLIASGFMGMNAISTRDQNSADIISELTGIKPQIVCDPVILYGYTEEMKAYTPDEKGYIIVYSYENNLNAEEENRYIRAYAREQGLKVYAVAYYHSWCDRNIQATPNELLGWIKNAELVVTDTFHGAVISLVCNTPMIVKLRGNQNKLAFLMNEYGLKERIISHFNDMEKVADCPVDFGRVNAIMEERRSSSMKYLVKALGK